jgi:hypothetical protein
MIAGLGGGQRMARWRVHVRGGGAVIITEKVSTDDIAAADSWFGRYPADPMHDRWHA